MPLPLLLDPYSAAERDQAFGDARARATPSETAYDRCRNILERIGAAFLLFSLSPLIAVAALAVRLTSAGPAFYSQVRLGRGGRRFTIYKLRSMYYNCEAETGPCWSQPNDGRVTRLGRLLRRSKLDELPQLLNIASGEMGFIGPRPERPEIAARLRRHIRRYDERMSIRPGLTGLAQVLQDADTDLESVRRKVALDRRYIRIRNAWLDLRILVGTALVVCGAPPDRVGRSLRLTKSPAFPLPRRRREEFGACSPARPNPAL